MAALPEQQARQTIDAMLATAGWAVQDYKAFDPSASSGFVLREVPLKFGRCDYLLLTSRKPVGLSLSQHVGSWCLKTLANKKTSNPYAIAESLGGMPGGCIVWICYDRETFRPLHYHLMGGRGNDNMRSLSHQTKAKKRSGGDREGYRKVKIKDAESQKITLGRLVEILFDLTPSIEDGELSRFSTLA